MSELCGEPTPNGPCRRAVSSGRCWQHGGVSAKPDDAIERVEWAKQNAVRRRKRAAAAAKRHPAPSAPTPISDAQVAAIATALNFHNVEYIVIGGIASQLHGAEVARTADADVVVRRNRAALERLSDALNELDAKLRVEGGPPEGVAVPIDRTLFDRVITITFVTAEGPLDVCFRPDGTEGYDDLIRSAETKDVLGVPVPVAALADVIRSKDAAGRAKDRVMLPALRRRLRELLRDGP